jgi:hypothetical protein
LWIIRRQGQLGAGLVHNDLITERAWERLRRDPSMPQRWELVADRLDAGEAIQFDTLAKWRELGAGHDEPEAEGFLVLTDRRLLFATFALGVHLDVRISRITNAWVTRLKARLAHLEVETGDRRVHAFWTAAKPAWLVVGAVHGGT